MVRGTQSCGTWLEERRQQTTWKHEEIWLTGYLSGMAVALKKDILKDTDNNAIFFWVDNYCRDHSLQGLDVAGEALFYELVRNKKL